VYLAIFNKHMVRLILHQYFSTADPFASVDTWLLIR
jgi:hypothetical protein